MKDRNLKFLKYSLINIKTMISKSTLLFVMIVLTQIISIIAVFFSLGVMQNTKAEKKEDDVYSRMFTFEFKNNPVSFSHFDEKLNELVSELSLDYEVWTPIGKTNNTDDSYNFLAVNYNSDVYDDYYFTASQYLSGEKFIIYNNFYGEEKDYQIGEYINIQGLDYLIIRLDSEFDGDVAMPYKVVPDDFLVNKFFLSLKEPPSKQLIFDINSKVNEDFQPENTLNPRVPDLMTEQFYESSIAIAGLVIILVVFNTVYFYRYIFQTRRNWLSILRLYGCKQKQAVLIYLVESILLFIPCFLASSLIFKFILAPKFVDLYPVFGTLYTSGVYIGIFIAYFIMLTIFMLISTVPTIKKSALSMKRGV